MKKKQSKQNSPKNNKMTIVKRRFFRSLPLAIAFFALLVLGACKATVELPYVSEEEVTHVNGYDTGDYYEITFDPFYDEISGEWGLEDFDLNVSSVSNSVSGISADFAVDLVFDSVDLSFYGETSCGDVLVESNLFLKEVSGIICGQVLEADFTLKSDMRDFLMEEYLTLVSQDFPPEVQSLVESFVYQRLEF